jgi:hypothetical protein
MGRINETDNEYQELLARLDERTKNIETFMKKIDMTLHGNSKEGLCAKVDQHDTYFKLMGVTIAIVPPCITFIINKLI